MKEFVEKLIERLEEELKLADGEKEKCARGNPLMFDNAKGYSTGISTAISIVKDLAEEHSHCAILEVLANIKTKMRFYPEELSGDNNGWISVEDKLPPRNESVLCWAVSLARGGDCCCLGSCDNGFWFMQTQIDTYSFPQQYKVVAWHKLPAPYKKGE